MDPRPWMERVFGRSWHTSVSGYGGGLMALTCILLGYFLDVPELIVTGLSLLTASVALVGQLARSQAASEADHSSDRAAIREVSETVAPRRPPDP